MPKRINPDDPMINLMAVSGVEGPSAYLNDFRIAGPKPWGGGSRLMEWGAVRRDDVVRAVFNCTPREAEEIIERIDQWLEKRRSARTDNR